MREGIIRNNLIALFLAGTGLYAGEHESSVQPYIDHGQYKEAIAAYKTLLLTAPPEKQAWMKSRLAIAYEKDQDQQQSFQTFLSALEQVPIQPLPQMSKEEQDIYHDALKTYMEQSNISIQETAEQILNQYQAIVKKHPEYHSLKLLVALAEANLGQFESFYIDFYDSYQFLPEHPLSYKTQAILHIKLYDRAKTKEDKERERESILLLIKKSIDLSPSDRSLYKMAIAFSPEGELRKQAITTYLPIIIDQNIILPRCDIAFYIKQAIAVQQPELAQHLIDKAREWYQYSKVIEQSQQFLDEYKKGR